MIYIYILYNALYFTQPAGVFTDHFDIFKTQRAARFLKTAAMPCGDFSGPRECTPDRLTVVRDLRFDPETGRSTPIILPKKR